MLQIASTQILSVIFKHKQIATPLALKPLHCLRGSPCLTSCLLLRLRWRSVLGVNTLSLSLETMYPDAMTYPWPLGGWSKGRAALSIPGTVGVPSQTTVGAGSAIDATAMQRHLGQPSIWRHIKLLLQRHKQNNLNSLRSQGISFNICTEIHFIKPDLWGIFLPF